VTLLLVRALFDINVLIALFDTDHIVHRAASRWFAENLEYGWASCPITENGTARVMASADYPNPLPVAVVLERIAVAAATEHHRFWSDDLSLTDSALIHRSELLSEQRVTDQYLLALAIKHGGRLVTFSQGISPGPVVGALPRHLVQLMG
jgi:toxin-antitoxin system PIN domain toxin